MSLAWESVPLLFHVSDGLFSFSSERKEEKKRRQKLRFWISLRAFARSLSRLFYHANAVPWKFPLNVALSLLLFPLPLPRPTPGGVSKGEGPQSRPFVPRGGMGDGWRPPCFGWGSKGEGPLRQRPLPLAPTWECPLAGAENYAKAHGDAVRFLFSRNHDGCPSKFQALRKGK